MNEGQIEQHKKALQWQSEAQLRHSYRVYVKALLLRENGLPPTAAAVQFFIETWREVRRRCFTPKDQGSSE